MCIAFLSPCICEGNYGGVQLSGRLAYHAIHPTGHPHSAVCYRSVAGDGLDHTGCTGSKLVAAALAGKMRARADKVLVWHVDLLKLLPLVKRNRSKAYLFLHGIEGWQRMSRVTDVLLRNVDVFLTNSQFTWTQFLKANPNWQRAPHHVVPLGAGIAEENTVRPESKPAAIIIGRMDRGEGYKGHSELLQAWPEVRRRQPDAELWIAGTGNLESELKTTAQKLGIHDSVRFYGRITEELKVSLIRRARCLLLPSRGEGFGLVYLEAMRQGRPCLVSTVDAGRETILPPEAGLAVDPNDVSATGDAVVRLLSESKEWELWSFQAKQLYESRFTAGHFEERLLVALNQ